MPTALPGAWQFFSVWHGFQQRRGDRSVSMAACICLGGLPAEEEEMQAWHNAPFVLARDDSEGSFLGSMSGCLGGQWQGVCARNLCSTDCKVLDCFGAWQVVVTSLDRAVCDLHHEGSVLRVVHSNRFITHHANFNLELVGWPTGASRLVNTAWLRMKRQGRSSGSCGCSVVSRWFHEGKYRK